jgi:integrase
MPRIKLTEKIIARLKGRPASSNSKEPIAYWDLAMPGFGVIASSKTGLKSYVAQRDLPNGKTRRVTIGIVGSEIRTLDEARAKAADVIHGMRHGIDPKAARKGVATLQQAMEAYISSHPNLSAKSIAGYRYALTYLADWKDLHLTEITPDMIEDRHKKLGKEKGGATANGVMRSVRAWYYYAIDRHPELTANPVKLKKGNWFKVGRRERHVSADQLPKFYAAVMKLENPIARDYLRLLLFTGLRREEAAGLTWQDIDFTAKVIRFPAKRTKPGRTLDLPMSDIVRKMLKARREIGDAGFVFPAHGKRGHISEPKFPLGIIAEETGIAISAHDLRRTFTKAAIAAGIHMLHIKALLNHAVGDDVTVGYAPLTEKDLEEPVQKVARQIEKWARAK